MASTSNTTVGDVASTRPASIRVFQRHHIDFCCGGRRPLAEAAAASGVPVESILDEITAEEARALPDDVNWSEQPANAIVDHLLERYHKPLRPELARLEGMAQKVLSVHGPKDPERLQALARLVGVMREDLDQHMGKEENVLFPWIRAGGGPRLAMPIRVMLGDHEETAQQLAELTELTGDFVVPEHACATWRALWRGLQELDVSLRQHLHLENNVLFPKAMAGTV